MSISRLVPPLEYLRSASRASLQSFELTRLNHASNLRREIAALVDQWIQETSEAALARWMLDQNGSPRATPLASTEACSEHPGSESDPLPDSPEPSTDIVRAPPRFSDARQSIAGRIVNKPRKQRAAR